MMSNLTKGYVHCKIQMHGILGRLPFYIEREATHGGKLPVKRIDTIALKT